jgi:hypothetical protein
MREAISRCLRSGCAAALAALALGGCASLGGGAAGEQDLGVEVRPEAPPEYDVLVAQQHQSEGQAAEALAAYERAVAKDEDSAYLQRLLADALARAGRLDDALVHARRAYDLDPQDEDGRHLLVQLLRIQRDVPAIEALLLDDKGAPRDGDAAFALHEIYIEAGRAEDALVMAEWLLHHDSDPLRAQIARANAFQRLGRPLDAEGAWAAGARPSAALLENLLAEPYFARRPPKSTGRDLFNEAWLRARLPAGAEPRAVQATLLELTARSIADALARDCAGARRLIVCGGGVHNRALMARLAALLAPVPVESSAAHGIDPGLVEPLAFAWLAKAALEGEPASLASVTGAQGARVLGAIYPP